MTDSITLTGLVATEPRRITTSDNLTIVSFRLASSQNRFDRSTGTWVPGETNWYTVSAFRRLAVGAGASLAKGDRVLVSGRVRIREWSNDDRSGTTVEIEAESIGHDLTWGTSRFTRTPAPATDDAAAGPGDASHSAATSPGLEAAAPITQHWAASPIPANPAATVAEEARSDEEVPVPF